MSTSPRSTHARSGHSARRRAHIEESSAPIRSALAALNRRPGQIKCKLLLCRSADSAAATRRRGRADRHRYRGTHRPGGNRRPRCPLAARRYVQRLPYPPTNSPRVVPLKPTSAGPGPTEREPRSHCLDVTHHVRGRSAQRARHRRGHIFSPADEGQSHQGRARRPSQRPHPGAAGTRAGRWPCVHLPGPVPKRGCIQLGGQTPLAAQRTPRPPAGADIGRQGPAA
jgi:hypothetical protein